MFLRVLSVVLLLLAFSCLVESKHGDPALRIPRHAPDVTFPGGVPDVDIDKEEARRMAEVDRWKKVMMSFFSEEQRERAETIRNHKDFVPGLPLPPEPLGEREVDVVITREDLLGFLLLFSLFFFLFSLFSFLFS